MSLSPARLLIVDDEPANTLLLKRLVEREGIGVVETAVDGSEALARIASWQPDLVLLDLNMPRMNGLEVLRQLESFGSERAPVIVLTADATTETKQEALTLGAADFIVKPFDRIEVILRIRNHLREWRLRAELRERHVELQDVLDRRTRELDEARLEVLERLAIAAEFRDDETHEHTRRVGDNAGRVAAELGVDATTAELITLASPLHDIGKIGIPDEILLKPAKLTEEEFAVIRQHVRIGARILADSSAPVLQMACEIAFAHHERWDGSGYLGQRGLEIALPARIVASVDVFDALTSRRPYKDAWPAERAVEHIAGEAGKHFDPDVVSAFLAAWERGTIVSGDPDRSAR